ncbi:hypothetical protein ACJIZ3_024362 [Penstemon smallii]|uniref:Apple domain-containing protein n=1 Tax=Penstemon smallii TaxID=265156 RepID=A0ABD3TSY4_9LAMI
MDTHIIKHLLLLTIFVTLTWTSRASQSPLPTELLVGFKAHPDPSISSFQPLLTDSSGNYSLGFLRVNRDQLSLSILHVPSSVPFWSANTTRLPRWADPTRLFFNGSLILSDSHTGVFWSTYTNADRVWLSNTSNLEMRDGENILWESFKFPSDTLVERQNFSNTMSLVSSNGIYSMRLGSDFFGLYANFRYPGPGPGQGQIYLKHRALEAKADIVEGQPIKLILQPDGYLGMFQNGSIPVDVESFNSFQQNVSGIRRVRLEPDGNLKGYYWTGTSWVLEYQAISDPCELPSSCGSYGLCKPGQECSCLDNRMVHGSGGCGPVVNRISSDFCGEYENGFKILRRSGVELPFKELMGYIKMDSLEKCEGACEGNCTCWGVVYSNSSGFCYMLDYPIQSLLAVGDETKVGYFKVREGLEKKEGGEWLGLGLGLLFGAVLIFAGVLGLGWYRWRSRGVKGYLEEDGVGVGAYKDLGAASFRSIELSEK